MMFMCCIRQINKNYLSTKGTGRDYILSSFFRNNINRFPAYSRKISVVQTNKPADLLTVALWKIDDPAPNHGQRHKGPSACMPQLRVQAPLFP
jgi:hypothetical protein